MLSGLGEYDSDMSALFWNFRGKKLKTLQNAVTAVHWAVQDLCHLNAIWALMLQDLLAWEAQLQAIGE